MALGHFSGSAASRRSDAAFSHSGRAAFFSFETYRDTTSPWVVGRSHGECHLALAGSTTLGDWILNVGSWLARREPRFRTIGLPCTSTPGVEVEASLNAEFRLWVRDVLDQRLLRSLNESCAPDDALIVSGHSRGGMLAHALGPWLTQCAGREVAAVVTFGAPRFVRRTSQRTVPVTAFVDTRDVVAAAGWTDDADVNYVFRDGVVAPVASLRCDASVCAAFRPGIGLLARLLWGANWNWLSADLRVAAASVVVRARPTTGEVADLGRAATQFAPGHVSYPSLFSPTDVSSTWGPTAAVRVFAETWNAELVWDHLVLSEQERFVIYWNGTFGRVDGEVDWLGEGDGRATSQTRATAVPG